MTLIRKLASALCLALLFSSYSNAQVDPVTGNLINTGTSATNTTSTWNNGVYVNSLTCWAPGGPGNCGPNPSVLPSGQIHFSYGQVDLNQVININRALAAGGTGVQLSGFNFSFTAKNGNGWDDGRQDYLAAYVKLYGNSGLMANYDYSEQTNRKYNWTNFNFSETFASPIAASNYTNAQVGFVGRDNNFWAGPYGPEIINVNFALKYRVDPCAQNPAYSPTCSGFNAISTGSNVFNSSVWSNAINQSVAINTALRNGGIGATVHGFNYGFDYTIGQSWSGCTATNQDGSCSWYMNIPAQASVTAQLTNSNNQSLFSKTHTLTGDGTSGSVSGQYLLPTSLNQTSLGNVRLYGNTSGTGSSIGNFSASLIYTADPCVTNPLYNSSCDGYAVAFAKNMLLGSTVASASGPITSSGSTSISTNTGTVDQSNPQPDQPQQTQQQTQQTQQSSPSPTQDASQNPSVAQDNPAQPSPTQAGPASTTPQPAGGPPQTATASAQSSSGPSGGSSAGPSKLAMSVVKTAQANDKATQNAAVQNAAKTLDNATQSSQASSSAAVTMNQDMSANSATAAATFASTTTQASMQVTTQSSQGPQQQSTQTSTQTQQASRGGPVAQQQQQDTQQAQSQSTSIVQMQAPQQQETQQAHAQTSTSVVKLLSPQQQEQQQTQSQMTAGMMPPQQTTYTSPVQQQQDTQSTQVAMLKPPTPLVVEIQQQSNAGTGLTVSRNMFAYNPLMSSNSSNTSMTIQQSQPVYQPRLDSKQYEIETSQMPIASFTGSRAGNPLSEIMMQQRFEMMQSNISQPLSSVNRNVQPNDLAAGVDIASMASVPVGFNAYSFVLKDSAFYEPKEVYKNQRTVDNARVLRGLTGGSDAKHQEMVNQQYKGN
jgi:hypothetical protein